MALARHVAAERDEHAGAEAELFPPEQRALRRSRGNP
jgi:hypothetical protein